MGSAANDLIPDALACCLNRTGFDFLQAVDIDSAASQQADERYPRDVQIRFYNLDFTTYASKGRAGCSTSGFAEGSPGAVFALCKFDHHRRVRAPESDFRRRT